MGYRKPRPATADRMARHGDRGVQPPVHVAHGIARLRNENGSIPIYCPAPVKSGLPAFVVRLPVEVATADEQYGVNPNRINPKYSR